MQDLLERADIRVNGDRPWDIQLHAGDVPERALATATWGWVPGNPASVDKYQRHGGMPGIG
ncbi:hypothetical protein [Aquisalimonas sp.]|uniref:hypothetical protein n=1 Tax=Aquisalimonas sp. TaxID=1872621 RepID=UPI0025BFA214|nr:hypothetical protein [Aquisalimonas sp.]